MSSRATFCAILFRRVRPDNVANLHCKLSLLRARRERPRRRRAAEQRDEIAPFQWPMSPVLPTGRIAHLGGAGDLLHCGISSRAMAALGHSRQIDSLVTLAACPLRSESGQIAVNLSMSALCQKRTHALQRNDAMGLNPRPMVPLMHPWLANRVGQRAWYRPAGQSE